MKRKVLSMTLMVLMLGSIFSVFPATVSAGGWYTIYFYYVKSGETQDSNAEFITGNLFDTKLTNSYKELKYYEMQTKLRVEGHTETVKANNQADNNKFIIFAELQTFEDGAVPNLSASSFEQIPLPKGYQLESITFTPDSRGYLMGDCTVVVKPPKVGDSLGDVLYSDITAYINGEAIPTSVINGKTLVVVEDLAKYGFDVKWNGTEKTLNVELNKGKAFNPIATKKDTSNTPGTFKEKYVYTDIKTYISDEEVECYAIKGVTLIDFDALGKFGKFAWDAKTREIKLTID